MKESIQEIFWEKWFSANELERLKLVQTLTGFKDNYSQASLLNSYLNDLVDYLEDYYREFYDKTLNE